jgi:hypothetical protein
VTHLRVVFAAFETGAGAAFFLGAAFLFEQPATTFKGRNGLAAVGTVHGKA